jgi:hypothetical protein
MPPRKRRPVSGRPARPTRPAKPRNDRSASDGSLTSAERAEVWAADIRNPRFADNYHPDREITLFLDEGDE